jgi:outer membrane immunogenic protein
MRALRLGAAIAAMAAGLCAGTAHADGPPPSYPPGYTPAYAPVVTYDWTGIYLGGHIGASNSRIEWVYTGSGDNPEQSDTSFAGGGHVGLQKQWGSVVFGAEATYTWMDHDAGAGSALVPDLTLSSNAKNLFTVAGKFGFANENMLAYFKGGYATGTVDFRTSVTSTGVLLTSSSSREHGWTAGVGLEYALWNHVIIGVAYDYVRLNVDTRDQVATAVGPPATQVIDAGVDIQMVTARLSFKFGGTGPEPIPGK